MFGSTHFVLKSHVSDVFLKFKALVEIFFKTLIISIYSNSGGEYKKLKSLFTSHVISHLTTPPHVPQHNGVAERRHRHVVESWLTLLHQASMPLLFWSHAFQTTTYLINRLPTITLNYQTSFQKLFGLLPNYQKLRIFWFFCYPWLKPYTKDKLEPKLRACVFVGYSSS